MEEISLELIVTKLVPWPMDHEGSKKVEITGMNDKHLWFTYW